MKLIGSKSRGQHVSKDNGRKSQAAATSPKVKKERGEISGKKKTLIIILIIVGLILLFSASVFAVVRWEIQPMYDYFFRPGVEVLAEPPGISEPVVTIDPDDPERPPVEEPVAAPPTEDDPPVEEVLRNLDKFTFLIFGFDEFGNTDVVMVAAFDTVESSFDIVSIPRDTMVNVSWNLKKVNSIQPTMVNRNRNENNALDAAMQATIEEFRNLLGFEADFWVTVNMRGFIALVNAVGPIGFNVPSAVHGVPSGQQRLNGEQAMEVVRQRANYSNQDLGRVNTQQNFLKAVAAEVLANRSNINVTDLANIFVGNVKTDIQLTHLIWLGKEFLKLSNDDISFTMLPGKIDSARGESYVTIILDEWLEIINSKLSPLTREITADDVSILTRGPDRRLFVTDGNWQGDASWGSSSR